ncbi:MAG: aldehyde dehydrogenase family protein [Fimbriimonadaceae bacterium]|nr:aldehyde dehydrogenase family protein [Fimbriimonadaceae bacterium]
MSEIFQTMEYGPAPEGDSLAVEWLERHGRTFGHFIGGKWRKGEGHFETFNPANAQVLAKVAQGTQADVDAAVKAARKAQPDWAKAPGVERARYLYAIARQVQKHSRLFAVLESMDNGKPIRETRDIDIPLVARHFYHHAGWATLLESEFPDHEAVGVAGQIIPWNFPLLMLSWKIAPALAAGNCVVLKPAEFTPLTALLFAEICDTVGLPPGVVNILTGDGLTGKAIVEHPGIDKIAFTGSTEVGRIIREATAGSGKKLSLELGGKSPFIVFDDADQDSAIEGLVDAIWFNQGQVCCAGSRLLVQESVAEKFLAKLRRRMETLRVGDPLDKAVDIGAIVAPVQLDRIAALVSQGREEGAELFQPSWACPKDGWFYPPTLLTNVAPSSTVAQVEIFGPVLVAMSFRTPSEAVALANNTPFGLAASVWSENLGLALDIAGRVKAGTVWVNCTNQFDANSGFGGYRESGYGREGGREGMYEYLKLIEVDRTNQTDRADKTDPSDPSDLPDFRALDRTHKQYIGGKQARPDSGYSLTIKLRGGGTAEVARGNRKDIRNAVEAARMAQPAWAGLTAHGRAQILYYLAENLSAVRPEFLAAECSGAEFDHSVNTIITCAAWADKFDGQVHTAPWKGVVYTLNEALGVVGIVCPDDLPLLGLLTLVMPAIAMGNTVVVLPSEKNPLPAVELYRVLETSDIPGGVINICTGLHAEMSATLAGHDDVDAIWHFGSPDGQTEAERLSIGNLKQTWTPHQMPSSSAMFLREAMRRATQVKNVWVPVGE